MPELIVCGSILKSGMSLNTPFSNSELLNQLALDQILSSCILNFTILACFCIHQLSKERSDNRSLILFKQELSPLKMSSLLTL